MNLRTIGCNVSSAAVDLRERLAFDAAKTQRALTELSARFAAEVVVLDTCNRVELYVSRIDTVAPVHSPLMAEFLSELHGLPASEIAPHLYEHADTAAAKHLFRVASGLDSVVLGEAQIAGQVKDAYETAQQAGAAGPLLNALFSAALRVSKRVRSETGIGQGHVSVSSAALDFVRVVFNTFTDKTVLVIGAGKMGRLTLKHLADLHPAAVLVTNRSSEKAATVANDCGGRVVPWEQLDEALVQADIVLSTTGAPEPIVSRRRFDEKVRRGRGGRPLLIFDMAVPRDFDASIHDGEVSVFNVDDLTRVADRSMAERRRHLPAAETIVETEVKKFVADWNRRANGPVIGQLTAEVEKIRDAVLAPLLDKLNGKLTDSEKAYIEGAFRLFQNRLLHGPIAALHEASHEGHGGLREALMKLFGLKG
ncbi:MAG: glutamyl-tRNA reductase [Planctomycetia bacterium]|nr:glutamyl-tRNA reductase [Planctomycetia bacterium]